MFPLKNLARKELRYSFDDIRAYGLTVSIVGGSASIMTDIPHMGYDIYLLDSRIEFPTQWVHLSLARLVIVGTRHLKKTSKVFFYCASNFKEKWSSWHLRSIWFRK